jgi:hypothetical protein
MHCVKPTSRDPSMIEPSPFSNVLNDGDRSRRLDRLKKDREEAASKRRPLAQVFKLLLQTINSKRAELRVFFANLAKLDIFWNGPPGSNFLHTIPDLNDHARPHQRLSPFLLLRRIRR